MPRAMEAAGADVIDIGAESTRPGFSPVDESEEWARLEPVLAAFCARTALPVSIDTSKAAIARKAMALGAAVINDVTGLRGDPACPRSRRKAARRWSSCITAQKSIRPSTSLRT